jgi:hypothetical protein
MTNIKYQNYKHYKLPITTNPLDYGKLILNIEDLNLFVVQVNRTNVALILQHDELNHIKIFKEGDLVLDYNDHKTDENIFIRSLNNTKFTFKNNELFSTDYSIVRTNLIQTFLILNALSYQQINSTTLLTKNKKQK